MNVKGFFVDTLSSALELGIATPDDIIRHVTPDILAVHLPRPLWARLLTAALGAPKVDAQLVIETIGVPNLCEHVPSTIIWACVAEIGQRALSGAAAQPSSRAAAVTPPVVRAQAQTQTQPPPQAQAQPQPQAQPQAQPLHMASPPPPEVKREPMPRDTPSRGTPLPAVSAAIPRPSNDGLADVVAALESDERQTSPAGRTRSPTGPRFRQSNTGVGRLGAMSTRRPQAPVPAEEAPRPSATSAAAVAAAATATTARPVNRGQTEADESVETDVKDDWKSSLAVEDEQLVDWQASEETVTGGDEYRKR